MTPKVAVAAERRQSRLRHGLRAIAREAAVCGVGAASILGLERLREEIGADWFRIAGRVHQATEDTLTRRLGRLDMFQREGELNYILVFGELTGDAAKVKVAMLGQEILQKLFGSNPDQFSVRVAICTTDVDARLVTEEVDPAGFISRRLEDVERTDIALSDAVQMSVSKDIALRLAMREPAADETINLPWIKAHFLPVWDRRADAVFSYLCEPTELVRDNGRSLRLTGQRTGELSPIDLLTIDAGALGLCVDELTRMEQEGHWCRLIVPVHYGTLAVPRPRGSLLHICRQLPPEWRRYFVVELKSVPHGVPGSRLAELCNLLRPHFGAIYVRHGAHNRDLAPLRDCGVLAGGLDISADGLREAEALKSISKFAGQVSAMRLSSYVVGVPSLRVAAEALEGGVDMMCGDGIRPGGDHPGVPYRWTRSDLFGEADRTTEDASGDWEHVA